MKQLKMLWRCRETAYPDNPWQGFRYRPFSGSEEDVRAWLDICKNGPAPAGCGRGILPGSAGKLAGLPHAGHVAGGDGGKPRRHRHRPSSTREAAGLMSIWWRPLLPAGAWGWAD